MVKANSLQQNYINQNHVIQLPETMMVCSSPQETHTTLSSRSQNFPGTLSLNLHLPNVNTAPVSINNNTIITPSYDAYVAKKFKQLLHVYADKYVYKTKVKMHFKNFKNWKSGGYRQYIGSLLLKALALSMQELFNTCNDICGTDEWPKDFTVSVTIPTEKKYVLQGHADFRTVSLVSYALKMICNGFSQN